MKPAWWQEAISFRLRLLSLRHWWRGSADHKIRFPPKNSFLKNCWWYASNTLFHLWYIGNLDQVCVEVDLYWMPTVHRYTTQTHRENKARWNKQRVITVVTSCWIILRRLLLYTWNNQLRLTEGKQRKTDFHPTLALSGLLFAPRSLSLQTYHQYSQATADYEPSIAPFCPYAIKRKTMI